MTTRTLARDQSRSGTNSFARDFLIVVLATALLAMSAHVQLPGWPVKVSMQTAAVFAVGIALGSRLGAAAVILYVVEGALGLPVFQNGSGGPAYLVGPTGGYLLGFAAAAWLVGRAAETGQLVTLPRTLVVLLAATAMIYVPGVGWLATLFGPEKALAAGLLPFLVGDALKIFLLAMLVSVGIVRPARLRASSRAALTGREAGGRQP